MTRIHPDAADSTDTVESLTDPAALGDRDDVAFVYRNEATSARQFERFEDAAGLAVVGVENDAGETLLVADAEADDPDNWMLPFGTVEPGDDWTDVAVEWVDHLAGVDVTPTGVEAVRRIDISVAAEGDDRENRVHEVVLTAVADPDATIDDDPGPHEDDHWNAAWFDSIDDERIHDPDGNTGRDVRRFLD